MIPVGTINYEGKEGVTNKRRSNRTPLLCRIQVERDITSLNKLIGARTRTGRPIPMSGYVKQWKRDIFAAQSEQLGRDWITKVEVNEPHPIRRIEIVRRCRRMMDTDNLWGGVKLILDALKSTPIRVDGVNVARDPGWFYDDSPKYIDLQVGQIVTGEKAWTELSLFGEMESKK